MLEILASLHPPTTIQSVASFLDTCAGFRAETGFEFSEYTLLLLLRHLRLEELLLFGRYTSVLNWVLGGWAMATIRGA